MSHDENCERFFPYLENYCNCALRRLEADNKRLRERVNELRDALEESLALNINWSSEAEPEVLAYYSEYRRVIKQANAALGAPEKEET